MPIRNEHVHFFVPRPRSRRSRRGTPRFSAPRRATRNNAPMDDIPGVQLRFNKADMAQAPTKGRVLDHIGFDVVDLKAFIRKLEAEGIKLDRPYSKERANRRRARLHHRSVGHLYRAEPAAEAGLSAVRRDPHRTSPALAGGFKSSLEVMAGHSHRRRAWTPWCPGHLRLPSLQFREEAVDARDKRGHDAGENNSITSEVAIVNVPRCRSRSDPASAVCVCARRADACPRSG